MVLSHFHQAISEELKARQEEILKNYNQFCRLVGNKNSSEGLQVVPAEKVLRFSDDYSKFLVSIVSLSRNLLLDVEVYFYIVPNLNLLGHKRLT